MEKLGWRKLLAWFLIYAATYTTLWMGWDMTPITADVIKSVTFFFFAANAWEHTTGAAKAYTEYKAAKA